ncbi:MAG: hypothetical protein ACRYFX_18580 [Janthinobacterium lividum]
MPATTLKAHNYVEVTDMQTSKVIKRMNVSDKSPAQVERVLMGMLRNMNTDRYCVGEQDYETAQPLVG